ncbi:MAG: hypothetical protein CR960_00930 [Pasteurellales bacterium]|nr:MAG: hypothetical protein CR960_00930 [Pasteurellales bacterium]
MIIPYDSLSAEVLDNILTEIILREGTDYGAVELSLAVKKKRLLALLESKKYVLVWSELHQSIDIKDKNNFLNKE